MVVLDASAAVELVAARPRARAIADLIRGNRLSVPAHFDAEALAGIRGLVMTRKLSVDAGIAALHRIAMLEADRVPLTALLGAAFAQRDRFSPHDALYAVLARRESGLVVTTDAHFAKACAGFVEVNLA